MSVRLFSDDYKIGSDGSVSNSTHRKQPVTPREGLRVKLVGGGDPNYAMGQIVVWCAGKVKVGTVGTVYRGKLCPYWCVLWDGIKAQEGYEFAIPFATTYMLEEVEEESKP